MEYMESNEIAGLLAGAGIVIYLIGLLVSLFTIVCMWKIYVKMGEPGWVSIVPFYNNWKLFEHVWNGKGYMMFASLIPVVGFVFPAIAVWRLYKCFGKGTGFCIAGFLVPMITLAICAFGNAEFTDWA